MPNFSQIGPFLKSPGCPKVFVTDRQKDRKKDRKTDRQTLSDSSSTEVENSMFEEFIFLVSPTFSASDECYVEKTSQKANGRFYPHFPLSGKPNRNRDRRPSCFISGPLPVRNIRVPIPTPF